VSDIIATPRGDLATARGWGIANRQKSWWRLDAYRPSSGHVLADRQTRQTRITILRFPTHIHTHKHPFNGLFFGTTQVSRHQKGKTNLDFTEARDSEWQWHQLGHMLVCTSLQTDNHANTHHSVFYRPDRCPYTYTYKLNLYKFHVVPANRENESEALAQDY